MKYKNVAAWFLDLELNVGRWSLCSPRQSTRPPPEPVLHGEWVTTARMMTGEMVSDSGLKGFISRLIGDHIQVAML